MLENMKRTLDQLQESYDNQASEDDPEDELDFEDNDYYEPDYYEEEYE